MILLDQDTTELDVTRPAIDVDVAGLMGHGRRSGAFLHLQHAFTPDGCQFARKPFEEKETYRWLKTADHCSEVQSHCPKTQTVMLADRECDITQAIDYCLNHDAYESVVRVDGSRILHKQKSTEPSVELRKMIARTKTRFSQ